jgi:hypothetical protein
LQDTDLNMYIHHSHNVQDHILPEELQIPKNIPENMIVAIKPDEEYNVKYWLAKIICKTSKNNYQYIILYFFTNGRLF